MRKYSSTAGEEVEQLRKYSRGKPEQWKKYRTYSALQIHGLNDMLIRQHFHWLIFHLLVKFWKSFTLEMRCFRPKWKKKKIIDEPHQMVQRSTYDGGGDGGVVVVGDGVDVDLFRLEEQEPEHGHQGVQAVGGRVVRHLQLYCNEL